MTNETPYIYLKFKVIVGVMLILLIEKGNAMMQICTTEHKPEKEQFNYWCELVSSHFTELSAKRRNDSSAFKGKIKLLNQAGLTVSEIASEAQTVNRARRSISSSSTDECFLLIQEEGVGHIAQDEREVTLRQGEYAIVDPSRPYQLSFEERFEQICFSIPHSTLLPRINNPRRLTAIKPKVCKDLESIGLQYINALRNPSLTMNPVASQQLVCNFLEFLPILFNEAEYILGDQAKSKSTSMQIDMLFSFIRRNLASPGLNPKMAANELGISLRYVHKLFSHCDYSFSRWVLMQRLNKCAEDLSNPSLTGKSIAEIAFSWGFNDLSHFGRNFKSSFNATPREWRSQKQSLIQEG